MRTSKAADGTTLPVAYVESREVDVPIAIVPLDGFEHHLKPICKVWKHVAIHWPGDITSDNAPFRALRNLVSCRWQR